MCLCDEMDNLRKLPLANLTVQFVPMGVYNKFYSIYSIFMHNARYLTIGMNTEYWCTHYYYLLLHTEDCDDIGVRKLLVRMLRAYRW